MLRTLRLLACSVLGSACGAEPTEHLPPIPGHEPGSPGLGAHAIAFHRYQIATTPPVLATPPMATAHAGSTIIVGVGRGDVTAHTPPSDSKGNAPFRRLGDV